MRKKWLYAAMVRAVKTFCQTAIASIGTSVCIGEVNWMLVLSSSTLSALLSVLTSVAGLPEVDCNEDVTEK